MFVQCKALYVQYVFVCVCVYVFVWVGWWSGAISHILSQRF